MRSEYKELMRKLKNASDDLVTYANNEDSLKDKNIKELQKLDKKIVTVLNEILEKEK